MKKLLIWALLAFCMIHAQHLWCADNMHVVITDAQEKVSSEFGRLDAGLKRAAVQLGLSGLTGDSARAALTELCGSFSYAVDCAVVDPKGKMLTVEPAAYRRFERADISGQEQVKRMMQEQKPVLSSVFKSVEGFEALDAEYPVTAQDGSFLGSVSLLFRPEKFLGDIIQPLVHGIPMDIWAMERGGYILYDADKKQIGLNLFDAPLYQPYPSLLMLGRQIAQNPAGAGNYTFLDRITRKVVTKNTYWQTASMYGTDWRLVGIHVESKEAKPAHSPLKQ